VEIPDSTQRLVDSRQSTEKKATKSTIDYKTQQLRTRLHDPTIGEGMVALALTKLGEAEIESIAAYALRKGTHPGKVFVKICSNAIKAKYA